MYDLVNNHAGDFGLKVDGVSYDFSKIIKRSRNVSTKIVKGVEYLIKKNKIDHIKGFGKLKSKSELEILDGDGKVTDTISADHIILSTGARPKMLDSIPVDRANIITSTEAMSLKEQPKELIVIGAGAIGVEFAYFYNVLGTKVTIIEMMDRILPIEDKEVSGTLERNFEKRKIDIYTNTKVEKAEVKDGIVTVTIEKDGEKKELKADKVLNAIGVTGNIENIGLEELGVEIEKNHIRVNKDTYRTNVEGVYAIGDVITRRGLPMLHPPKQFIVLKR